MTTPADVFRPNQPLRPPRRRRARQPGATTPAWPSYSGTAERLGASTRGVTVYVDPSLGQPATQNAQDLLAAADRVVAGVPVLAPQSRPRPQPGRPGDGSAR